MLISVWHHTDDVEIKCTFGNEEQVLPLVALVVAAAAAAVAAVAAAAVSQHLSKNLQQQQHCHLHWRRSSLQDNSLISPCSCQDADFFAASPSTSIPPLSSCALFFPQVRQVRPCVKSHRLPPLMGGFFREEGERKV